MRVVAVVLGLKLAELNVVALRLFLCMRGEQDSSNCRGIVKGYERDARVWRAQA